VKVYLDENLSAEIARLLRDRGVDAISAHEVRRRQAGDQAQLEVATAGDRGQPPSRRDHRRAGQLPRE
jgi:predicted nuclease of predicted toxin-antitoxin system